MLALAGRRAVTSEKWDVMMTMSRGGARAAAGATLCAALLLLASSARPLQVRLRVSACR